MESAYFDPRSIRKTSKQLNIDTDAKFRFERGIDPLSVEKGLKVAAKLIKEICGGEISKIDIQKIEKFKLKNIKFELKLLEKTLGFKISIKEITKILENLGFKVKKNRNFLDLKVPSWRLDIEQPIDIVEELIRIYGYDKIKKLTSLKREINLLSMKLRRCFIFYKIGRFERFSGSYNLVIYRFRYKQFI